MRLYELIYIARSDLTEAQVQTLNETIKTIVESKEGNKIVTVEPWGVKTLAYKSKKLKKNKGYFCAIHISLNDVSVLLELKNKLLLNEAVLRFIIKQVEEFGENTMPTFTTYKKSSVRTPNTERQNTERQNTESTAN